MCRDRARRGRLAIQQRTAWQPTANLFMHGISQLLQSYCTQCQASTGRQLQPKRIGSRLAPTAGRIAPHSYHTSQRRQCWQTDNRRASTRQTQTLSASLGGHCCVRKDEACAHAHAACTCSAPLSAVGLVAVAPAGRPRRLCWRPLRRSPPPVAPVLAVRARQAPHRRSHDRGTMRRLRRAKVLGRPVWGPRGRRRAHSAGSCHARRRRGPPLRRRQTVAGGHAHVCAVWRRPRRRGGGGGGGGARGGGRAPPPPPRAGAGALSKGLEQGVRSGGGPACCTLLIWLDRQAHYSCRKYPRKDEKGGLVDQQYAGLFSVIKDGENKWVDTIYAQHSYALPCPGG